VQSRGAGDVCGPAVLGGHEAQLAQRAEDERAGGAGGTTGVEAGDLPVGARAEAGLALDEREDEQGQADHVDEGVDALVGVQEHRRDRERALERAVAPFGDLLALVAGEYLGGADGVGQVRQQGVPAVGGGLGVEGGLVEMPGQDWFPGSLGIVPGQGPDSDRPDCNFGASNHDQLVRMLVHHAP